LCDNCAHFANEIFYNDPSSYNGSTLVAGALFYFRFIGDFSGYSDIALGVSSYLGLNY
jgi:D-alanyl-lipoteichoic acid acyltransferase DltB (MBOAT superfamily)